GPVREVHIFTDRPARFWAQGLPRPAAPAPGTTPTLPAGNVNAVRNALAASMSTANVAMPAGLRWDLYLGPVAEDIPYHPVYHPFPANGQRPPVKLFWYDGGLYPPRPDMLPDDVTLVSEGGGIFIGDKGVLVHETYGDKPRLYPSSVAQAGEAVPKTIERI